MADTLIREATAYGSQPLSPVPQYWDGVSGYAKVQGINGAIRAILFNSAGETFTGASPGSVKLTATSTVAISGVATVNFSGSGTVVVSGTATVNFSGSGTVEVVSSAGASAYFSTANPGNIRVFAPFGTQAFYTATATWSAGLTATSSQTLTVGTITASLSGSTNEIVVTNDGPYALTLNVYKTISANGSTFNTSALATVTIPAEVITAGVTINATRTTLVGMFNFNTGFIFRLTTTAAFTAQVTNNVIIKEVY